MESRLVVARVYRKEGKELTANGYGIPFVGDEIILELDSSNDCTIL